MAPKIATGTILVTGTAVTEATVMEATEATEATEVTNTSRLRQLRVGRYSAQHVPSVLLTHFVGDACPR